MTKYSASDEVIARLQSVSGLLTTIKTKYGGAGQMVERPDCDDARTDFALNMLRSLKANISKVEKELAERVKGKARSEDQE